MSKVFVVNNNGVHDMSSATQYGAIVDVTKGKAPIFRTDTVIHMLKEGLKDFNENDYLLLAGPMVLNVHATHVVSAKLDKFKMLIFDAKEQAYKVRHFNKSLY